MVRDEAPIIEAFLDQALTFFDMIVFLDHSSVDSTVSRCLARDSDRIRVLRLQAAGYPQSEVMTLLTRQLLLEEGLDAVFTLDCDEFLPFADDPALQRFLLEHKLKGVEAISMPWLNICPRSLDGGNIFADRFFRGEMSSVHAKVVVLRALVERCPGMRLHQGNHGIDCGSDPAARTIETPEIPVLHIPIQSSAQLALKLSNGYRVISQDSMRRSLGLGRHWIDLALNFRSNAENDIWLRRLGLGYPELVPEDKAASAETLDFDFPYIKAPYAEASCDIAAVIVKNLAPHHQAAEDSRSFRILSLDGDVLASYSPMVNDVMPAAGSSPKGFQIPTNSLAERYADLVEPLFSLPVRLQQPSGWTGHIPFLFVLFKLLKPASYVELGVHLGASLTAAATAARTYHLPTRLYGIDTWAGDEHTGFYQGDQMYEELRQFAATFPAVSLIRSLFSEARPLFKPGSIDLLHIDGLHTYEAVKEDFQTWLSAVSENGVILFHDICVLDRRFGVHRLWEELKKHYTTSEFHHSFGLGVLFLNDELSALKPLLDVSRDADTAAWYRSLVADIASTLPDRMRPSFDDTIAEAKAQLEIANAQLEAVNAEFKAQLAVANAELEAVKASTSWRITSPLRSIRTRFG